MLQLGNRTLPPCFPSQQFGISDIAVSRHISQSWVDRVRFSVKVAFPVKYLSPELAASFAVCLMVVANKILKLSRLKEILAVFHIHSAGRVSTVEKKARLEYRTMHSSYQITPCLDREHSVSEDNVSVAFTTHCLQRGEDTSPLHMNRPYTVSEEFLPATV
ncbi:hypothetical protein E2542_SST30080 [Spatholobus suberectus]|nr:hypothetical protein E2542_SST30080 [Spatholobus suberectus]